MSSSHMADLSFGEPAIGSRDRIEKGKKRWHEEIKGWLTTCIEEHGDRCRPSRSMDESAMWLIDVEKACIVPAKSHRYIALSYVWGDVDSSRLTMKNMTSLQVPGALNHDEIKIPRTISDTMALTGHLGYYYLWVDLFCIVQDDMEMKHGQILQMADIYSNADLTIIAAGSSRGSNANNSLGNPRMVTISDPPSLFPSNSQWYTRGWTFQELYFSSRKVKFQNSALMWECRQQTWCMTKILSRAYKRHDDWSLSDNSSQEDDALFSTDLLHSARITPWPIFTGRTTINLDQYAHMVTQYNSRHLTYPEDGMAAFLGVTNWLSNSFRGGFLWGLPVESFDIAILWQPCGPLTRRNTNGVLLPSWSWVGWQGAINEDTWARITYDFRALGLGVLLDHRESCITPLCRWYFTDGESRSVVETKYDNHQHKLNELEGSPSSEPAEIPTTVDIGSPDKLESNATIERPKNPGPLIWTHTERVALRLGASTSILADAIFITSDSDDRSKPIGIIHAIADKTCSPPQGAKCTFIALSKGVARRRDHRYWNSVDGSFDANFEYYNAMWVEHVDSSPFFSRKGLAMVSVEGWRSAGPEMVDVTLG